MLYLLGTLRDDPRLFVLLVSALAVSLIIGLSFHEFSHALVGDTLGDPTPRRQGRLSLDPSRHLDPLGSMMLVLAGFGWAKPVRINPFNLRFGPRVGMAVVAVAGPLSNFALAGALAVPVKSGAFEYINPIFLSRWDFSNYVAFFLVYVVLINITLGVFNLLPIPPMDGSRLAQMIPGDVGEFFRRMEAERWGLGILLLLLALPFFTSGAIDPLGAIIRPIRDWLIDVFLVG